MKILYHHRIASKDGQYVHIDAITTELDNLDQELVMVAPSVAENSDFGSEGGWVSWLRSKLPGFVSELMEFAYSLVAFVKLAKAIKQHSPDVIYERYNLYLPSGIWAKKLFGIPLLLEVNAPLYQERAEYGGVKIPWLAKWTERYAWKNADKVLPVSHVLASHIYAEGVDKERVVVIPNGANIEKFGAKSASNRKSEFSDKLVVGFVGFCREWHKLDEIVRLIAAHENSSLFFLIVGDGPIIDDLKALVTSLGIENRFYVTGLVQREDMPYWLDQIDIALQSSVTPWASPLKLLEYMAKELAILAPNSPNITELVTDNDTAVLFDEDNFDALKSKLNVMCGDPALCQQLGKNARRYVLEQKLTWNDNAKQILALASDAIQRQSS